MGMYTGLRFKGTVKEEFRDKFEDIAMEGRWYESDDYMFYRFSGNSRAQFIPCGCLAYMPEEWEIESIDRKYTIGTDGFHRTYDKESGRWTFQCSLKNYERTIEDFLDMVPYFVEDVEHAEIFYEEWDYSEKWELIDGKMVMTNDKFINYTPSDLGFC